MNHTDAVKLIATYLALWCKQIESAPLEGLRLHIYIRDHFPKTLKLLAQPEVFWRPHVENTIWMEHTNAVAGHAMAQQIPAFMRSPEYAELWKQTIGEQKS